MYNKELLNEKIKDMFKDMKIKSNELIDVDIDFSITSKNIMDTVSSEIVTRSKTLIIDMYAELSKHTLNTEEFREPERKSKFYEANIRGEILNKYNFDVGTISSFETGIKFEEVNKLYASIATSTGTMAVGGVLKYVLTSKINIPLVVIIAGAVATFCTSYFKSVPDRNKLTFKKAIEVFLDETEYEFIQWFDEIEIYYKEKVDELVATF